MSEEIDFDNDYVEIDEFKKIYMDIINDESFIPRGLILVVTKEKDIKIREYRI